VALSAVEAGPRLRALPRPPLGAGVAVLYLSFMVALPVAALASKAAYGGFWHAISTPNARSALVFTFWIALLAAAIDAVTGLLIACVLVRDEFPGKRVVNAIIDLPFALPTIVAGLVLLALYGPDSPVGVNVAQTRLAVLLALLFVSLPFVVRSVQPVLRAMEVEAEEAAATLGASGPTIFRRVVLPALRPAIVSGAGLGFARAVGEFGSVIFIAGNLPNISEIAPLLIVIRLSEYRYADATAIAVVMLVASFVIIFAVNRLQRWAQSRMPAA
jgi:sulfate transport system permease protein